MYSNLKRTVTPRKTITRDRCLYDIFGAVVELVWKILLVCTFGNIFSPYQVIDKILKVFLIIEITEKLKTRKTYTGSSLRANRTNLCLTRHSQIGCLLVKASIISSETSCKIIINFHYQNKIY